MSNQSFDQEAWLRTLKAGDEVYCHGVGLTTIVSMGYLSHPGAEPRIEVKGNVYPVERNRVIPLSQMPIECPNCEGSGLLQDGITMCPKCEFAGYIPKSNLET